MLRGTVHDSVTVTNRRSAHEATQHLAGHGWRNIVAVDVQPYLYTCRERVAGYRAAMKALSLEPRVCLVEHENSLTAEWLTEQVFRSQKAEAILSLNWVCTMLTLRGLRQLGRVPGKHVAMLSFDDFELADMLTPGLSAIQQPADDLGREAPV